MNISNITTLSIPLRLVLARLGYADGVTTLNAPTQALIDGELTAVRGLLTPRRAVASAPVRRADTDRILLDPALEIVSGHIARLLDGCTTAWGFAVTIGPHLEERRARLLAAGETARAVVLDAIGSVAAEELAERMHEEIRADARARGATVTPRFSPGYGDWSVAAQPAFLRWLGAEGIGIRLTEHAQMVPEKSVSAILGERP